MGHRLGSFHSWAPPTLGLLNSGGLEGDLQYLVGQSPVSAALGFVIRGTKSVSESQVPQGTLTYMLDKKRCVAFLSATNLYKSIPFADDSKCQR